MATSILSAASTAAGTASRLAYVLQGVADALKQCAGQAKRPDVTHVVSAPSKMRLSDLAELQATLHLDYADLLTQVLVHTHRYYTDVAAPKTFALRHTASMLQMMGGLLKCACEARLFSEPRGSPIRLSSPSSWTLKNDLAPFESLRECVCLDHAVYDVVMAWLTGKSSGISHPPPHRLAETGKKLAPLTSPSPQPPFQHAPSPMRNAVCVSPAPSSCSSSSSRASWGFSSDDDDDELEVTPVFVRSPQLDAYRRLEDFALRSSPPPHPDDSAPLHRPSPLPTARLPDAAPDTCHRPKGLALCSPPPPPHTDYLAPLHRPSPLPTARLLDATPDTCHRPKGLALRSPLLHPDDSAPLHRPSEKKLLPLTAAAAQPEEKRASNTKAERVGGAMAVAQPEKKRAGDTLPSWFATTAVSAYTNHGGIVRQFYRAETVKCCAKTAGGVRCKNNKTSGRLCAVHASMLRDDDAAGVSAVQYFA